jgi:hypothetical protein
MEIHRLLATITEQDLNDLARHHLPKEIAVEDLEICIAPEGVRVRGVYHVFAPVTFDSLWELGVAAGKPVARLASFKTMGIPVNVLKSLVLNVLADVAKKETWLTVNGDSIELDIDGLLHSEGLTAKSNLKSICCEAGKVVVEV